MSGPSHSDADFIELSHHAIRGFNFDRGNTAPGAGAAGDSTPGFGGSVRVRGDTVASSRSMASSRTAILDVLDSNGTINCDDLCQIIEHQAMLKSEYSQLKKIVLAFFVLLVVFFCAIGATTYVISQDSKDTNVESGVLVSKITKKPLATASTDMAVQGNVMMIKNTDGSTTSTAVEVASVDTTISMDGTLLSRGADNGGDQIISTSIATKQEKLTSLMSDTALRELRLLSLTSSGGASINLNVQGFVRLPKSACRRSVVKLFTAAGVLMLNGSALTFDTDVSGVFAAAGFELSTNPDTRNGVLGRHLLADLSELIGLFNFIGRFKDSELFNPAFDDDAPGCDDSATVASTGNLNLLSDRYRLTATGYNLCFLPKDVATDQEQEQWCTEHGAKPHPSGELTGLYFAERIVMIRDGVAGRSRAEKTPSWDKMSRTVTEVQDSAVGITKSASTVDGQMYDCKMEQLTMLPSLFDGIKPSTMSTEQLPKNGAPATIDSVLERVIRIDIDSFANKDGDKDVPDDELEMLLHLRVWQEAGQWKRFQITDSKGYGVLDDRRPLGWTWETFFDVEEMVNVDSFPADAFLLSFAGLEDSCNDSLALLEPLVPYPSDFRSDIYQQFLADKRPVPPQPQEPVSPASRKLTGMCREQTFPSLKLEYKFCTDSAYVKAQFPTVRNLPITGMSITGHAEAQLSYNNGWSGYANGCIQLSIGVRALGRTATRACIWALDRHRCNFNAIQVCMEYNGSRIKISGVFGPRGVQGNVVGLFPLGRGNRNVDITARIGGEWFGRTLYIWNRSF